MRPSTPRKVHILLTSVGGLGVPKLIEALRAQPEFDLTITGVDAVSDAVGVHFVDYFFRVPRGDDPRYAEAVLDICRKSGVELIIPQSDAEAVSLSEAASHFSSAGCTVLGSPYQTTRVTFDKYLCLCHLRDRGVPVPRFHRPRTVDEAEAALADLGYPNNPVVFKPIDSAGSRGFRLVCSEFDELGHILTSKKETLLSARRLLSLLSEADDIPAFLLMEYLAGEGFSVDVLVRRGKVAYVIPQRRLVPRHGSVEVALVEENEEIRRSVESIVNAFSFQYVINIDMGYRHAPRKGGIFPYDVNARPSAIIAVTSAAGSFLLAEAIFDALGIESPPKRLHAVKMVRYWSECYIWEGADQDGLRVE
jgi:carbamoyl-phosphate synthase large subunit